MVFFRPPSNPRPRSGSSTTTGTRSLSCLGAQESLFAILGPASAVGRTSLARPEFVWHLPPSEDTLPVIFRLLAPNEAGVPTLIHTVELEYKPGYNTYQLPVNAPSLTASKEYRMAGGNRVRSASAFSSHCSRAFTGAGCCLTSAFSKAGYGR